MRRSRVLLDIRTLFLHAQQVMDNDQRRNGPIFGTDKQHFAKVLRYPCGVYDIIASSSPCFREPGWEEHEDYTLPQRAGAAASALAEPDREAAAKQRSEKPQALAEDLERSMRRARAKVRRLALSNDFRWFVTLTLDEMRVDRYDPAAVVKKLNQWCSNQVQRHGLRYVLVPERHKDGALHFHGFFSGEVEVVDSGTIRRPGIKKPRKPRSKAERQRWLDEGGQVVYNLPGWNLGFSTAMEVYGEYPAAVAYVCKYIGKEGEKPAGRWYYSGGALAQPETIYADFSVRDLVEEYGKKAWCFSAPGMTIAVVNGIKEDTV